MTPTSAPTQRKGAAQWPLTRRTCLGSVLLLLGTQGVRAAPGSLPIAVSLHDELAKALQDAHPLVVMVSLEGCPFCKTAREHYLIPLRLQLGLPVVQVDMRSHAAVKDFKDTSLTHNDLVRRWDIKIAPTVLFFGRGGVEIAPRLVGGGSADYYGAYLDQRLAHAQAAI